MCFSPLKCLAAWISRLWVHPRGRAGWQSHVERPGSPRPGDLGISNENGDFAKKNMEISWDIRGYDIWYNYDITYCPKLTQNMVDLWGRYHIHYTYREKLCFLWRILHGISPSKWPSGGIPQFHPNWRYRTGGAWINDWDLIIWPRKVG